MKKHTKIKKINFFEVLKFLQTHFYLQKIYVAADLQQGTKLCVWCTVNICELYNWVPQKIKF